MDRSPTGAVDQPQLRQAPSYRTQVFAARRVAEREPGFTVTRRTAVLRNKNSRRHGPHSRRRSRLMLTLSGSQSGAS
jgi:hypothetical protein